MEGNNLEGKRIAVFYDDLGRVSRKDGVCSSNSETEIVLDDKIIIQKNRIVRIEVVQ